MGPDVAPTVLESLLRRLDRRDDPGPYRARLGLQGANARDLQRKQMNVVRATLVHCCACVLRSKVEPMKEVVAMMRRHLEGIAAWAQTLTTNCLL